MSFINQEIKQRLLEQDIEVFFVSGKVTKWWNAQRTSKRDDVCLLGGYYWAHGSEEVGPFRTPSAAWRDAYYRRVLKTRPPLLSQDEVRSAQAEIARDAKRAASHERQTARVLRRVA